jgi:8-oxo-dGTP pyrophosphatase MutT (NUDIX family)
MTDNLFATGPLQFADAVAALILIKEDGRYLMQLRDDKPGIFYPDHWGLFGGAVEAGEQPIQALRRELQEELALCFDEAIFFTDLEFGLEKLGHGRPWRKFYEVTISAEDLPNLRLAEGSRMEAIAIEELLLERKTAPYDSYAIWLHNAHQRWRR